VLSTAGRVKGGDADAWVREWCATAERLEADARQAERDGRRVSARGAYLGLAIRDARVFDWLDRYLAA
jgi:hypothetical protein